MGDITEIKQLTKGEVEGLLEAAERWRKVGQGREFAGRTVANLFFEPSTRTHFSFMAAQQRLGLHILNLNQGHSSTTKGETLYDTLQTLAALGVEVAVIRMKEEGVLRTMREQGVGPTLISGGEGTSSHPTQALLDLLTIKQHFGEVKGLKVAMVGDVAHSRVVHSNLSLLKKMGATVLLSGPEAMRAPALEKEASYVSIDEAVETADVMMMLRVQLERHQQALPLSVETYHQRYGLTLERGERLQSHSIIMHPGPVNRGVEIADYWVEHERTKILAQVQNGLWMRMAVMERALS
ncbi:aspartate carbamoyltransferase catalytic subunit [Mechercharimyces sp. CAU 1602]|uniref:aspartate carbamoyltransferase catalytic subunit n=1 Tax=Mechercharimyces sp. CAU 1602 TaxID=2973933 RepID=UPI002161A209|nr:aspartate carbamoyltransferase catalytic subunit [Mechercharimyces sp. CAU 1602]MCS1350648.1 aspartate carbamoyltransferase catalytic subunit [Mechercharimyces sp. CAU 1602]